MGKVTKLDLEGYIIGGSDREISESLNPIEEGGSVRRTINGALRSISNPAFRKFAVSLSGSDLRAPAFSGFWLGEQVEVGCISELTKRVPASGSVIQQIALERPPVAGSVAVTDEQGNRINVISVNGNLVAIAGQNRPLFVTYRPILQCIVTAWSQDEDEASAVVSWSLEMQEV